MDRLTSRPETPDHVVLLDDAGNPSGVADRTNVHTTTTPLHLAFSSYLFNAEGQVLLTRRALSKITWPGVWTNSCCGHPRPGESLEAAIRRRIHEELGATVDQLQIALPKFQYRATDASGIVENEICPVYLGLLTGDVQPNPDEVMDYQWVEWGDLVAAVAATPQVYSPWASEQVPQLATLLPRLMPGHLSARADVDTCLRAVDALIDRQLDDLTHRWNRYVGDLGCDILPDDLPHWLRTLMRAGGKRFRVTMAYWGFISAGGVTDGPGYDALLRIAAAVEMLHLFALVHDDVMDESDSRRSRPSAHVESAWWHRDAHGVGEAETFGRNLAILLGDLAHLQADAMVDPLPQRMRDEWYEMCIELIAGQRADLTGTAAGRRDLAHAQQVAKLKSGSYTVTRPLILGAMAAGAAAPVLEALRTAGEHIGQAFAYRDDILGVWGDPAVTGKPAGEDLIEGKSTVILALAQDRLSPTDASMLDQLGTGALRPESVCHLQRAIVRAGILDEVEHMITDHLERATAALSHASLHEPGVAGLTDAARVVAWRNR